MEKKQKIKVFMMTKNGAKELKNVKCKTVPYPGAKTDDDSPSTKAKQQFNMDEDTEKIWFFLEKFHDSLNQAVDMGIHPTFEHLVKAIAVFFVDNALSVADKYVHDMSPEEYVCESAEELGNFIGQYTKGVLKKREAERKGN